MSRTDEERLRDILASIEKCERYATQLNRADVGEMAYDAILRHMAVIGEAVRALSPDVRGTMSGIPWPAIAGLRNVVVHEYFRVERSLVVDIVENQLSRLRTAIQDWLDRR